MFQVAEPSVGCEGGSAGGDASVPRASLLLSARDARQERFARGSLAGHCWLTGL